MIAFIDPKRSNSTCKFKNSGRSCLSTTYKTTVEMIFNLPCCGNLMLKFLFLWITWHFIFGAYCTYKAVMFCLFLEGGCTQDIWSFLGQGLNLSYSSNWHRSCSNGWFSLTHSAGPGINPHLHSEQSHCSQILYLLHRGGNSWF